MDEPYAPEAVHARLCVVESDTARHAGDISQLWTKVTALEICVASLPDIKISLVDIKNDLEILKTRKTSEEGQKKGKENAALWKKYGTFLGPLIAGGVLVLIGFGLATYVHVLGGS